MSKILGKYKNYYEDIVCEDENVNNMGIYSAYNTKTNSECYLKVINKEKIKALDYNYLLGRINKEQEIQTLCNSTNTVNFYRRLETEENIIFELEYCDNNLENYLQENGELCREINFFKEIVISIAKALKTLHEKGIMHRDIKPHNIYIKNQDSENNRIIKLGNFSCSIEINKNKSESIGTLFYKAPEMLKELEYNEKVDLWSLGVTLYVLYFGILPYGYHSDMHEMMNILYDEENFLFQKTYKKNEKPKIPTLDILFKRLLTINPEDRMTYEEFFDYVFSDDFMKEDVICVNNNPKYKKIYEHILNEKYIEYKEVIFESEYFDENKQEYLNVKKIKSFLCGGKFPDIMNFSNASTNNDNKFNNIIYYDVNNNFLNNINKDSDYFEGITPGAFILCTNIDSFKLIKDEILIEIEKDKRMTFNLITTGSQCDKVIKFLDEYPKFKNCIKNICVYCANIQKWGSLKKKYSLIDNVVTSPKAVKEFIQKFSSEEIKPYPITKLITLNKYLDQYKDIYFKISQFYGDLTPETYKQNIEKMKSVIDKENKRNKLYNKDQNASLQEFLTFDLTKDLKILDKLIIEECEKNTFYGDLNKWLINTNFNSFEVVAYFTARFMYSLNCYANKRGYYYTSDKTFLYKGIKLTYSNLLSYERAKGKVILLSSFTLTSKEYKDAEKFSGRNNAQSLYKCKKKFSVILIIKNYYKKNWISNAIEISNLSYYKNEKEILYQPFSFYFVRDVQIDHNNYKADIYLEIIGKKEILEEQIKIGKEINFNEKEKIMEVK